MPDDTNGEKKPGYIPKGDKIHRTPLPTEISDKRITYVDRQRLALDLRKAGVSSEEITKRVGYASVGVTNQAIKRALSLVLTEPAQEVRALELVRLDKLLFFLWDKCTKGDIGAIGQATKIIAQRCAILGIDKSWGNVQIGNNNIGNISFASPDEMAMALAKIADRVRSGEEGPPANLPMATTTYRVIGPESVEAINEMPTSKDEQAHPVKLKYMDGDTPAEIPIVPLRKYTELSYQEALLRMERQNAMEKIGLTKEEQIEQHIMEESTNLVIHPELRDDDAMVRDPHRNIGEAS